MVTMPGMAQAVMGTGQAGPLPYNPFRQVDPAQGVGSNPYGQSPNPYMGMNAIGGAGMAGMGGPNPFAGMNPYMMGAGAGMAGLGQGTPQAPTGAWATNPSSAPPWFQAALQSPGGLQGYWQQQRGQQGQAAPGMTPWGKGPQGQPPPQMLRQMAAMQAMNQGAQGSGNWGGILSGMMGPRQPRQMQMPPQPRPSSRATYGGGSAGNISLSGY